MADWVSWVFSGIGVAALTGLGALVRWRWWRGTTPPANPGGDGRIIGSPVLPNDKDMLKARTHILFVDDDARFRVVDILKRSGWTHTRRVADLSSIDDPSVQQAHILFVDIHGVGKKLGFQDEGLGLASAIMQNYPKKKVVIYSAQTSGERFHEAFRKAADQLAKNADPYEFQQCAERLAAQVYGDS